MKRISTIALGPILLLTLTTASIGCVSVSTIHGAAIVGDVAKVKEFLDQNPLLVNARTNQGQSPLHFAVLPGHKDVVDVLLAEGADVNATDILGITPLHYAVSKGKDIAESLLMKGADVNSMDAFGRRPLGMAVRHRRKDIVELLLRYGADVNARDQDGFTPLEWAVKRGYRDVADILRRHGAK